MDIRELKKLYRKKKEISVHFKNMLLFMSEDGSSHYLALIIKQIHAIEKGLSMQEIRLGFGISRIQLMLDYIERYLKSGGDRHIDEIIMAQDVLAEYINIHEDNNFVSEEYETVKKRIYSLIDISLEKKSGRGGIVLIHPNSVKPDTDAFINLVHNRHSIRDFKDESVDEVKLKKAIELAMRAPSACNRQSTRVYVLDHTDFSIIKNWTGGVKNFLHMVDKIVIITGQMSAYEKDEYFQYTVSAGIFTGYLTLALQAYNIGACILQRPLISDTNWKDVAQKLYIPDDEQVVCAMAIGIPQDEIKVPKSQRLSYERIVNYVGDHYKKRIKD